MPGNTAITPLARVVRNSRLRFVLYVAIAALLIAAPFLIEAALGRAWVRIIDIALLFVMLALGLNIVVGYAGLLDLGYIAFFAVGAYTYALLASPQFDLHWSFLALLPIGALVAAFFGVLLGAPTLRLRGDYLAIVTLGFGEIVRIFLNNLNRPYNITNGPQGITLIDPLHIAGANLAKTQTVAGVTIPSLHSYYFVFLVCALIAAFISVRLENSRIGRAWIAIREDELAAAAMGINTRNVKLLAFAMGATFGGVAGGLFASFQGFISPESFTLLDSIMVLCMVVLGGMGNVAGVVLGAVLLTALPEALRYAGPLQQSLFGAVYIDPSDLRMLLFGLALVLMMLFRPAGLWPSSIRRRELAATREPSGTEGADVRR
ncbi:MAG: branched-chain amino acid transport system permease protein [Betaproteobacteria bacterium]|jgi:branched-chain amino acid transport system permease protein|nr:branched-chain amino acid transport system permease protein [Betaproteobacteria bacterium]